MPDQLPEERSPDELANGIESNLARVARELSSRLAQQSEIAVGRNTLLGNASIDDDLDDDIFEDDAAALRWRQALLRLSETFLDAAEERRDLSPILLGALHNALEQLLIHGEEADLMALEEWLSHEAPPASDDVGEDQDERHTGDFLMAGTSGAFNGVERRARARRSGIERRQDDRRS